MTKIFIEGFLISFGLILAIGAQNIYVLKRGLLKEHVFLVALTCALIDASLIIAGVKGIGRFLEIFPSFLFYITVLGILFLLSYGFIALKSAMKTHSMQVDTISHKPSKLKVFLTLLSLSFLNPHVYLDTVILIGTVGSKYIGSSQDVFAFGAMSASFVFFFGLAYGSRILIPLFKKPITWKYLDIFTAGVMFFIAYNLFKHL
jgi:L-lysine exporter family protein LysE/ArgO